MHNLVTATWMLHRSQNNKKIKHLHEICPGLIQNDKLSSYEELPEKDWSVSVHHRNILSLAIEMLQVKHGQSREIVTDIFHRQHKGRVSKKNQEFRIPFVNTVCHGSENTSY